MAGLIFLKVGNDSTGGASTAAISAAIRDAVDVYNANIVTMSYGGFNTYNDGSEEECQSLITPLKMVHWCLFRQETKRMVGYIIRVLLLPIAQRILLKSP